MVSIKKTVPTFSVDSTGAAKSFYGGVLGFTVHDGPMGTLDVELPGGGAALIYPKDDHRPADFTIMNFMVGDAEAAVDAVNGAGVSTEIYDMPGFDMDPKGVLRAGATTWRGSRTPPGMCCA